MLNYSVAELRFMKKYKLITYMLLFAGYLSAQDNLSALLPMPNQVKQIESKKDFIISGKTTIQTNLPEDAFCIAELKDILRQRTGKTPTLSSSGSGSSVIRLILDPSAKGDGHYLLSVSEKTVSIKGATQGSILYGLMTLDQILLGDVCRTLSGKIAPIEIDDQPRFSYRSLMSEEKILVSGTNFFTQADNFRNRLNKLMLTFENLMNIPTFTTGF